MSKSNRAANRIILIVLGLLWLAAGAWLIVRATMSDLTAFAQPLWDLLSRVQLFGQPVDWAIVTAVLGGVLLVIGVIFASTRGRGRTSEAAVVGAVRVDKQAVQDLFDSNLGGDPDVVGTHVQPWRVRGKRSWRIAVSVRTGSQLNEVADRVADAARQARERLGVSAPILLHLGGGLRAAVAHSKRAE